MIAYYRAEMVLQTRLRHDLGIDCGVIGPDAQGKFIVVYPPGTPQNIQDQGNAIAASWPNVPYQTRFLVPIRNDLNALTLARRQAIYNDLWSIPAGQAETKILLDNGPNAPAIWPLYELDVIGLLNTTQLDTNRNYATCLYVQDEPTYLINPPFDPSLNLPGWEPVT